MADGTITFETPLHLRITRGPINNGRGSLGSIRNGYVTHTQAWAQYSLIRLPFSVGTDFEFARHTLGADLAAREIQGFKSFYWTPPATDLRRHHRVSNGPWLRGALEFPKRGFWFFSEPYRPSRPHWPEGVTVLRRSSHRWTIGVFCGNFLVRSVMPHPRPALRHSGVTPSIFAALF